jgi:hypothetical protein
LFNANFGEIQRPVSIAPIYMLRPSQTTQSYHSFPYNSFRKIQILLVIYNQLTQANTGYTDLPQ